MNNIAIIDLHTHTINSPDGNHEALFMAETARDNKIHTVAFTDHCEVDYYYKDNYDKVVENSFKDVSLVSEKLQGQINILKGIELAQPHYIPELAKENIDSHNYDVVIGSIHNLREQEDFIIGKALTELTLKLQ